LEKRAGKYIPNQETMFHGRMGEPIPKWSRLEGGEWFQAQLAAGYTLPNAHKEIATSTVGMNDVVAPVIKKVVRRKKVASAESSQSPKPEPVAAPAPSPAAPAPSPAAPTTKKREPKKVGIIPEPIAPPQATMLHTTSGFAGREDATAPVKPKRTKKVAAVAPEITEVVPIPMVQVKPKRVFKPKNKVIGIVEASSDDIPVTKIQVKKEEIAGRSVYVAETKDKVYDLSYAYLGRWNRKEGCVDTTFPDSDAEP
jgi:hypothetical protein